MLLRDGGRILLNECIVYQQIGFIRYRAPELLIGSGYGKAVDMWAIGCIMGELVDGQPLFPGESEIDQLRVIQKVMGPLTPDQKEVFQKQPRFLGTKFPDFGKPETLEKHYLGKISKKALSFMKGLLKMDPNERMTASEALQHPYFEGLTDIPATLSDAINEKREEKSNSQASVICNLDWIRSLNDEFLLI